MMRQKLIQTFQIVSLLFLALPYFSALPVFGESVFTPPRFSQHQEFTPETEEGDTSESDSDVSSTESDSTSTEGGTQSQEEAIDTPVEEEGDTKEQIEFLPPALPTPFPEPRQGIAPKDLTLNNSKINVIDEDSSSTWVPSKFYHDVDISKATLDAQWDPAGTLGGTPKTDGLRFYIEQPKPELSDKLSGPAEYRTHPIDSNLWYRNIFVDGVSMDLKVNVTNLETIPVTSDSNITYLDDYNIRLGKSQGVIKLSFWTNGLITSSDYNLTFYKSGSTTPLPVDVQFMYGDQEGYYSNSYLEVTPSDPYPYPETFDPNNVPAYRVGEQMTIEDAFDPAQPDKFSKFDLFSPNGVIEKSNTYITDLNANANFNFGTFVYNSNALPKNAVIQKYFFYQKPTDTDEKYTGTNIDDSLPLEAQWSFRYSGTNTGMLKTQKGYFKDLPKQVTDPPTSFASATGYANQLILASISPSTVEEPKKYVSDLDEKLVESDTLDSVHERFEYTLEAGFPFTYYDKYFLQDWKIEDTLPAGVTLDGGVNAIKAVAYNKLSDEEGGDLTNKFNYNLSGSKITITAKPEFLNDLEAYQTIRNFRFHLPVRITDEKKVDRDGEGKIKIPNNFKFSGTYFNDETFKLDSNTVYTTAPQDIKNELKVAKRVDKTLAETGKVDDADTSGGQNLQPITYSVDVTNTGTTTTLDKVRVLDVLPNVDDGRNSLFNPLGSYTLTDLKFVDEAGKPVPNTTLYYRDPNNPFLDSNYDPNRIPDDPIPWAYKEYQGDVSVLKNSTALLVYCDNLPPGKTYSLKVSVEHTDNIGALLRNTATANSIISDKLVSNQVETKIYGRELMGEVWEDKNANGLKEATEEAIENLPVKLYRTSLEDPNFKDKVMKESLTGQPYLDAQGKSLVKTDANGHYLFKDLPEGEYVAAFEFDSQLYKVTQKLVDSPEKDDANSKVEEGGTQIVSQPQEDSLWNKTGAKLLDLPALTQSSFGLQQLLHNDMGLIPSAHLKLFKHEAESGRGLEGAVFELFKGDLTAYPESGQEDDRFVTRATTDSQGELTIDTQLFAVNAYTLFEVEAPEGYELYKKAIPFTVNEGKENISLDVSDEAASVLPFTGGNKTGRLIVLGALVLVILGLGAVGVLYLMKVKKAK